MSCAALHLKLLAARDAAAPQVKLFAGWRVNRQDSGSKRWASKFANAIRKAVLEQNPGTDWQQLLGGVEVTPDTAGAADLRVDEDDELASFKL